MKTKSTFAALLLGVLALLPLAGHAAGTNLTALLQQGLFEEQANRNLDAAIEDYALLAKQFDKDRQLAATAVFRLGECYRAQGKTNEAAAHYQRILRDFSDQTVLATLSRQNLAGMGAGKNDTATSAPMDSSDVQLLKKLEGKSVSELEQILPTLLPDAALDDLLQKQNDAQAKRAALWVDNGPQNVEVAKVDAMLVELNKQIENKIGGMMAGLKLRAELPASAAGDGRKQQKELLTKQITLADEDLADEKKKMKFGAGATAADVRAAEREVLRLRQQLVALDSGRAELVDLATPAKSDEDQEIARIEKMIQNSPDLINSEDGQNAAKTPLIQAASSGRLKVAAYLLDHGADVNRAAADVVLNGDLQQAGRVSPLFAAVASGNKAMTTFLIERGADVNFKSSKMGTTPLHLAAHKGFQAVVEVLLASHADANAKDYASQTPLFSVVQGGQIKIIQMLIAAGADPNLKDNTDKSVLNFAIKTSPEMFKLLLEAKTDPNTEDSLGRTPLSYAVERDSLEVVKMLLAAKADPNGGKLDAPLLVAIHNNDVAVAELLLQAGANPNAKSEDDWQPNTLGAYGRPVGRGRETPLSLAVSTKQLPLVQLLLKYKADTDDSLADGRPLLFSALSDTNILESLLAAGAKVDVQDDTWPSLHRAIEMKNAASVEILLRHGANPNLPAKNGYTPLHLAAAYLVERKIFELLLDAKAELNVRNPAGKTPLDLLKQTINQNIPENVFPAPDQGEFAKRKKLAGELADLLRQHGALDKLPDWDRIMVSRPAANFATMVFQRGTNDWNRFTLLELLYAKFNNRSTELDFADLSHIVVARPSASGAETKRIAVNLLNATNGLDVSRDLVLEFGDEVEIPERQHALSDQSGLLASGEINTVWEHLKNKAGEARLVVAGSKSIQLKLPEFRALLKDILYQAEAQAVLTSSSDLSRVKVTRRDAQSGKTQGWIVDCAPEKPRGNMGLGGMPGIPVNSFASRLNRITGAENTTTTDLWLRAGDVIEVPEKR